MSNEISADKPIRALLDVIGGQRNEAGDLVDRIPAQKFGKGNARFLRKLVLVAIAASADPDGRNSYPSEETLARRCLATGRAVRNAITHWEKVKVLRTHYKGGPRGTNRYEIVWPEKRKRKPKTEAEIPGTGVPRPAPGTEVPSDDPEQGFQVTRNEKQSDPERNGGVPGTYVPTTVQTVPLDRPFVLAAKDKNKILADLGGKLYGICGHSFAGGQREYLAGLLEKHSAKDIELAFADYFDNRTELQQPYTVKNFCEGGAEDALSNLYAGRRKNAENQATAERLKASLQAKAEQELAERDRAAAAEMADDPFFAQAVSG